MLIHSGVLNGPSKPEPGFAKFFSEFHVLLAVSIYILLYYIIIYILYMYSYESR